MKMLKYFIITGISCMALNGFASPVTLHVLEKPITIHDHTTTAFLIQQPDGKMGYTGVKGEMFDVTVVNKTQVPLVLHWHGIIDPNDQDGVPYVTQLPIQPGSTYHYHFTLKQAGTFWLHSHYRFQEQKLMAAPLIIHDSADHKEQEAIFFIQDFIFKTPKLVYQQLRKSMEKHVGMSMSMDSSKPDVNDVKMDAYLVNRKTLSQPDIVNVTPNQPIRLRIINASSSSNYYIDLGQLTGELIAIDGSDIKPITGKRFQIAIGNRLDVRINIPAGEGAYPILALPEGTRVQTGLLLATTHATLPVLSEKTESDNPLLNYNQDLVAVAMQPVADAKPQQSFPFILTGDMMTYVWSMNGQEWPYIKPTIIQPHLVTELIFDNQTNMAHPMHFHGHVFTVTEINGRKLQGRKGDTINVLPHSKVKVVFNANNPGIWMLHCHILYHQAGGMMTTLNYAGYPERFTSKERIEHINGMVP